LFRAVGAVRPVSFVIVAFIGEEPRMTSMQKVLLFGAIALFAFCSGSGLFIYYRGLSSVHIFSGKAVENEVAYQVQHSMENALVMHQSIPCSVTLHGIDLDISTITDTSGDRSVNIVNDDALILNGAVEVSTDGVDIYMADMHLHAIPAVEGNVFSLAETNIDRGITGFLTPGSSLEAGFERGVNEGLQRAHLVPTSVELMDEAMVIGCIDQGSTS
jgi:hypothetical protein